MFSTLPKTNFNFSVAFNLLSANAFNLDQSKILLCGKELKSQKVSSVFQKYPKICVFFNLLVCITALTLMSLSSYRNWKTDAKRGVSSSIVIWKFWARKKGICEFRSTDIVTSLFTVEERLGLPPSNALMRSWNIEDLTSSLFSTQSWLLTHYQMTKFETGPNWNSLLTTILNLILIAESSQNW